MTLLVIAPVGTTEFQHHSLRPHFIPDFGPEPLFNCRAAAEQMAAMDDRTLADVFDSARNLPAIRHLSTARYGAESRVVTIATEQSPAHYSDTVQIEPFYRDLLTRELAPARATPVVLRCDPSDGTDRLRRELAGLLTEAIPPSWWSEATRVVILIGATPQIRQAIEEIVPPLVSSGAPISRVRFQQQRVEFTPVAASDAEEPPLRALLARVLSDELAHLAARLLDDRGVRAALGEPLLAQLEQALKTPADSVERQQALARINDAAT